MSVFDRKIVFVVSTGRTGTQFFGTLMEKMVDGCVSVHEPDYLWGERLHEWPSKIKSFGLYNLTAGLFDPTRSVYMLSAERMRGKIDDRTAVDHLRRIRRRLLSGVSSDLFVEANPQLLGLVDLLPEAFPQSRIIFIVRDPRTWIRSLMNSRTFPLYSKLDFRNWFGLRIRAGEFPGDPHGDRWPRMSVFEKRCWFWNRANRFALDRMPDHGARTYRFEEIFAGGERESVLEDILSFATDFQGFTGARHLRPELLDRKVHSTAEKGSFPPWPEWDRDLVQTMERHCRTLMKQFHYGEEPEWRARAST